VLSVEECNSCSARRTNGLVKENLGDVAVGANVQGVLLASVGVLGITNSDNELARASPNTLVGGDRDLEEPGLRVSQLAVGVRIASNQFGGVEQSASGVAQGETSARQEREKLGVRGNDYSWLVAKSSEVVRWDVLTVQGCDRCCEPPVITMSGDSWEEVTVVFQASEVRPHVVCCPGLHLSQ
jgi:hypothetical protein